MHFLCLMKIGEVPFLKLMHTTMKSSKNKTTLFDRIGGQETLSAAVNILYQKVQEDILLQPFFQDVDLAQLKRKMLAFWMMFLGGPNQYTGQSMRAAHAHLDIEESHFNALIGHLTTTLEELQIAPELVEDFIDKALEVKADVMNKKETYHSTNNNHTNMYHSNNNDTNEVVEDTAVNDAGIYKALLMEATDAVVTIDDTKEIIFWNKAAEKLWGYTAEETMGKNIKHFVPQEHKTKHDNYVDQNVQTGVNRIVGIGREEYVERKDGTRVPILLTMSKLKRGDKTYFMATIKNISEQKDNNRNMVALSEAIDASYARIEFDNKGNILYANQNFADTLGYNNPDEFEGKHHAIFVEKEYRKSAAYQQFWHDLANGSIQDGEFKRISKQGDDVWIQAAYTPVRNEKGEVFKVIKIATDITNQKQLLFDLNEVIVKAGEEGQLETRLDVSQATGDWKELGSSVNRLLESMANPVMEISRIVEQLAEGNLTERFELEAEGDIKKLGNSLNTAIESMNVLLSQISQIGSLVAASAEEMLAKGEEMKNTTQEVASATQQMAEGAQQQAQQTDEANKLMDLVLKSAELMAEKAEFINKAAETGQANSANGLSTIKKVVGNMNEIQDSASSTAESITILSERSEEIASALSVITDIAAQTNLLALNAAIEAARAGDAGRGFAVVAEEIRKLAEGSRKSAVDIEKVIREVQKDITAASKAIETMETSVKSGTEASKDAEVVFESIEETSNETLSLSKEIVTGTDGQKESINTTAENIEKIVVVAEETASGTEQIASSGKVLSQGMNEVTATSEDLANVANQLQESISKFQLA